MTITIVSHEDCARHDMGDEHPESPARLGAINDRLISSGLDMILHHEEAPLAKREQLERVHDHAHVAGIIDEAPVEGIRALDPDTSMNPHTLDAALRAAGAVIHAVDLVMTSNTRRVFCNVRPPGHHAERHRAMGFCFFNNIAVGAAHALAEYGLERVAIVDFDVHHGNGTEDIFRDEQRILLCSSFQHPFYPFSGHETDEPHMVNTPLTAGAGGAEFRAQVEQHWLPRLDSFRPQLIMISAGFDAHREDEMAHIRLVEDDYAWVTQQLRQIALSYADGRMVSTLEGGYNLSALGRSAAAHINAML